MIAPVVASTSHTLVTRLPRADACGTRVQTMPLALPRRSPRPAPPAARAPRPRSPAAPASPNRLLTSPWANWRDARGLGQGTESLNRVLQAQCATRQGQGPGARLTRRPQRPETHRRRRATQPIFTPARRPRRDTRTEPKTDRLALI